METCDLTEEVLLAIHDIAESHGIRNIDVSERTSRMLVEAIGRAVMSLAVAADGKVTAVLAHTSARDGKVAVSVRRGKNEWQKVVVDEAG